jgi:hypothetical protein
VQPVGKLDQQHAHVLGYGEDKLAQVFRLPFVVGGRLQTGELGDTLDQFSDFLAERRSMSARVTSVSSMTS